MDEEQNRGKVVRKSVNIKKYDKKMNNQDEMVQELYQKDKDLELLYDQVNKMTQEHKLS